VILSLAEAVRKAVGSRRERENRGKRERKRREEKRKSIVIIDLSIGFCLREYDGYRGPTREQG